MLKQKRFRSRAWLAAVHELEQCVLCGAWEIQAAHRNEGKAMGLKADDCAVAALCLDCHTSIDQYRGMSREESRDRMNEAIVLTLIQLARRGLVGAKI